MMAKILFGLVIAPAPPQALESLLPMVVWLNMEQRIRLVH